MKLVADAGGTKTDWRLLDGDSIQQFSTPGFNPNTHDLDEFIASLKSEFAQLASKIHQVYFYGASIYPKNETFRTALASLFTQAEIHLNNDLVGSCRALSADEPAFVGISGTGSAGCFYDGNEVTIHPPSLGHSIGDEGSGAVLGKALLRLALRKKLDSELQEKFDHTYNLTKEEVYRHVYRAEHPNAYLASFTKFLGEHRSHLQIHELLTSEFRAYYSAYFLDMPDITNFPFHFTGSVAYFFGDYLRQIGTELGLTVGRIVQSPIAGLALYHQNHE